MKKFLASLVLVVSLVALVAPAFAKCEFGHTYRINPNCEKCESTSYHIYPGPDGLCAVCNDCGDISDNVSSSAHY